MYRTPTATCERHRRPFALPVAGRVMLATRVPRRLRRALAVHCARVDQRHVDFITDALREHLERARRRAL